MGWGRGRGKRREGRDRGEGRGRGASCFLFAHNRLRPASCLLTFVVPHEPAHLHSTGMHTIRAHAITCTHTIYTHLCCLLTPALTVHVNTLSAHAHRECAVCAHTHHPCIVLSVHEHTPRTPRTHVLRAQSWDPRRTGLAGACACTKHLSREAAGCVRECA